MPSPFTRSSIINSNLRVHIPYLQFPRNSPNGVAIPLAQSEWLLEPRRQNARKGWVRDRNCPVPRSLQHGHELQLLCERPFLKSRSSTFLASPSLITTWLYKLTADSFFNRGLQNEKVNSFGSNILSCSTIPRPFTKLKTFEKNKNTDSILYQERKNVAHKCPSLSLITYLLYKLKADS